MVRKFRDFLKDESATAAIEYIILAASIAVAIITAVKPANPSLACRACGRPMRFVTAIAKFDRHPELRTYECNRCKETVVEEWRPRESGRRAMPNSRQGARTVAEGLMVLRKKWGIRNLDIVLIFGTWAGSIAFGWKQQAYWLAVPPVVCVGYTLFLLGRHGAWAASELKLVKRKIFEMWMSGRTACLALFALMGTSRWVGVGGHQDNVPRRDLALETICPAEPLFFSMDQKIVLSHTMSRAT
jgi:Flp pilus assembly pilin Flp